MALGDVFSREQIEIAAYQLLSDSGVEIRFPIPVEQIAEDFLNLNFLWEPIREPNGTTIFAKLIPSQRLITFNESRLNEFDDRRFFYNTVLAHEIGHWDLHIERGKLACESIDTASLFQSTNDDSGSYWDEKNAHRYMASLLMPRRLIIDEFKKDPITNFSQLYALRDMCEVTVTSLKIRLEKLELLHIDEDNNFTVLC